MRWAFITPSYAGDYERCVLLCRSMDYFLEGAWHHYIVVDRPHFQMFHHLQSARRTILLTDDVLPGRMRLIMNLRMIGGRSLWWSQPTGFSLGWHFQQMVKLGMASHLQEDGIAYCDSDMFFLRRFNISCLSYDGKVRLYRTSKPARLYTIKNPRFAKTCLDMLNLPRSGEYFDYIDNFVTWHRPTVLRLLDYLGGANDGRWLRSFRRRINVSEYLLYGFYADEILREREHHFVTNIRLCKTQWHWGKRSKEDIMAFCAKLDGAVAVGVQSFLGVDVQLLAKEFDAATAREQAAAAS